MDVQEHPICGQQLEQKWSSVLVTRNVNHGRGADIAATGKGWAAGQHNGRQAIIKVSGRCLRYEGEVQILLAPSDAHV